MTDTSQSETKCPEPLAGANSEKAEGGRPSASLSAAEIETMIRVRDAAERELAWKYAIGGLIAGGLLTGGAAAGLAFTVWSSSQFFDMAKNRVDEITTNSHKLLEEFRVSQRKLEEERSKAESEFSMKLREQQDQFDEAHKQFESLVVAVANSQGQYTTLLNQSAKAVEGLQIAAKIVETFDKTKLTEASIQEIENLKVAAVRAADIADNSKFTIFPHYRKQDAISNQFRQVVRNSLTSEGFIIASESGDSTVASTKDGSIHRSLENSSYPEPLQLHEATTNAGHHPPSLAV